LNFGTSATIRRPASDFDLAFRILTGRRAVLNFWLRTTEHAMGATMPFSRYNADFNADLMEAMRAAFYRVCDILGLSGDREDPLTDLVVTKIAELAKAGERNPEVLCIDALAALGRSSDDLTQRAPPELMMVNEDER
jgi:hypothetical protein